MAPLRHDPAARRQRLHTRVSTLKRRFGIASVLGFGALFGLVTQHAVGSQKHKTAGVGQTVATGRSSTAFFDTNGSGYSFDDSGVRAAAQAQQQTQSSGSSSAAQTVQQQQPVAQSSGS